MRLVTRTQLNGAIVEAIERLRLVGRPHQRREEFKAWLAAQSAGSLTKCMVALSVLNQTKVYLY